MTRQDIEKLIVSVIESELNVDTTTNPIRMEDYIDGNVFERNVEMDLITMSIEDQLDIDLLEHEIDAIELWSDLADLVGAKLGLPG